MIEHRGRPLVVVAGPGTGKTRTLVQRMISLLKAFPDSEVVFITFTRTSRRDTQRRLQESLGPGAKLQSPLGTSRVSTLHTYAKSIVYRHADEVGRSRAFSILVESKGEKALVLQELASDLALGVPIEDIGEAVTALRCTGAWPDPCALDQGVRAGVLDQWLSLLRFYNTFDIQGLVCAAISILEGRPSLQPMYLHVDEYQDLNATDQQLVKLAAQHPDSEVVVVGDDAQSIYSLRHADYKGLHELWESKEWNHIQFTECHRLPPHIILASQALISGRAYLVSILKLESWC